MSRTFFKLCQLTTILFLQEWSQYHPYLMMFVFWTGQFITGWLQHNHDFEELQAPLLTATQYAWSGHFVSAAFENWESEFLQMVFYVLFSISLRQKGSSESKKLKGEKGAEDEEADREPVPSAMRLAG
ncbi:MAG TPA: DUF6766 family protein [Flavipsychrobacter sp.]|nr:DUF6766 family protein [Flavipsychrobacter sp.]